MTGDSLDTIVARCRLPVRMDYNPASGVFGMLWPGRDPRTTTACCFDASAEVMTARYFDLVSTFPDPVEPSSPTSTGAAAVLTSIPPEVS